MALTVKPLDASAEKYRQNAANASTLYATNAGGAGDRWSAATLAAKQTFNQAIKAAGIEDRWHRGVSRAGAGKYATKIAEVGQSRYSEGVQNAGEDWQTGFEPFASTLAGLTLPQRRPRGDAGNYGRVEAVGKALNAKRLALLGAGA